MFIIQSPMNFKGNHLPSGKTMNVMDGLLPLAVIFSFRPTNIVLYLYKLKLLNLFKTWYPFVL